MSVITAIKSNYGKYLARGAGAAALYFIALRITGYMPKPSGLIGYIRK